MTGPQISPRGVLATTNIHEAIEIVVGETGTISLLPLLPHRGLEATLIARSLAASAGIGWDRGPRTFRVGVGSSTLSRRGRDLLRGDADLLAEQLASRPLSPGQAIAIDVIGPLSLGHAVERADGNRLVSDRQAHREVSEAIAYGLSDWAQTFTQLCGHTVRVRWVEPQLAEIIAGDMPRAHYLDHTAPVAVERIGQIYETVTAPLRELGVVSLVDLTATSAAAWSVLPQLGEIGAVVDLQQVRAASTPQRDLLGAWLETDSAQELACVRGGADARAVAVSLARLYDELGVPRERLLSEQLALGPRGEHSGDLARVMPVAVTVAEMLRRDLGDL